jgi:hypothetical protein
VAFFRYSPLHSSSPPSGVIKGTLFGDPGKYVVRFVTATRELFAKQDTVDVAAGGSGPVEAKILICEQAGAPRGRFVRDLIVQYKPKGGNAFTERGPRPVACKC